MGSAAAYHLASRGKRVLGFDRFQPPHNLGSSHGLTRIIREAYFEHPLYVPLVQRAYQLWTDLEKASGRKLLQPTGGLMIGPPDGVLVAGAKRSAEQHKLPHQILSATELRQRFPVLQPSDDMVAVWEPRAGILFPELAIQTHLELAARNGATLRFNESVLSWELHGDSIRVHTAPGAYTADRLLLSGGAWTNSLLHQEPPGKIPLSPCDGERAGVKGFLPLSIERQILFWFAPQSRHEHFLPQNCPIHIWEYEPNRFFYGFPDLGDGVKIAIHHQGEQTHPDAIRRDVDPTETEAIRDILRRFLPAANGPLKSTVVCMYTNTLDENFILDHHPTHPQVLIASPCSGHGFKFSPVIGELAATLLDHQPPPFDLTLFRLARFATR